MKKKIIIALCVILAVVIAAVGGVCLYLQIPVKPAQTQELQVEGDTLRVGIISDLQLAQKGGSDVYDVYFEKALTLLKEKDVNVLINVGDYTDLGTEEAYQNYQRIYRSVYPAGSEPITSLIMGNHDYWLANFVDCWEIPFQGKMQRRFMQYTGEASPWTHKVINGYHFIGFSPVNGGMGDDAYGKKLEWTEEQIKAAVAQDPTKPVFVLTHNNPKGTVYTSEDYGCGNLDALFAKYPQVVNISGHTHASLLNELSIYQKDYTAIQTQSLSYTDFEAGVSHIGTESLIEANPMCMIMEIKDGAIQIQRYSVLDGKEQKQPWELKTPLTKESFTYTDARAQASEAPVWNTAPEFSASRSGLLVKVEFNAATQSDHVHAYRIEFVNDKGESVKFENGTDADGNPAYQDHLVYLTDFHAGIDRMASRVTLKLNEKRSLALPEGTYTIHVTALDSYGNESAQQTFTAKL